MVVKKRWGKVGAPHSAKRKAWLSHIRKMANPKRRRTHRR